MIWCLFYRLIVNCATANDFKKALAIQNPTIKGRKVVIKSAAQAARAESQAKAAAESKAKAAAAPPAKKAKSKQRTVITDN